MKTIRRPRLSAASVAPCSVSIASQSGVSRADSAIKPVLLVVVPMQAENGEGGSALEEDGGGRTDARIVLAEEGGNKRERAERAGDTYTRYSCKLLECRPAARIAFSLGRTRYPNHQISPPIKFQIIPPLFSFRAPGTAPGPMALELWDPGTARRGCGPRHDGVITALA